MPRAWPLFDLRIETPLLTLRLPTDPELEALADKAPGSVLTKESRHYLTNWTYQEPPYAQASIMQFHWAARANLTPDDWRLTFAIFPKGHKQAVGCMDLMANKFPVRKSVGSGSWLLKEWQGRGLGSEARAGILQLAFGELGAEEARSVALAENQASRAVSLKNRYLEDGGEISAAQGITAYPATRYLLTRDRWYSRDDIKISGLEECRWLLGV